MSRHIQPRIKGVSRTPRATSLLPVLDRWIRAEAKRFNVSPSFVLATLVAYVSHIEDQPDYRTIGKPRRPKVVSHLRRVG